MNMMTEFWEHEVIPIGVNASFIALVPNRDNPQGLDEF